MSRKYGLDVIEERALAHPNWAYQQDIDVINACFIGKLMGGNFFLQLLLFLLVKFYKCRLDLKYPLAPGIIP